MGTGTAFVSARVDSFIHFGGTALGGGTLCGLGVRLLGTDDVAAIVGLAASGDLHRVDLYVGDISREAIGDLGREITAANLGRLGMSTSPADLALGLLNLVVQNVALMAAAAARLAGVDTVVLNGTLATVPQAPGMAGLVAELTGIRFVVPEGAAYATAIGAALSAAGG